MDFFGLTGNDENTTIANVATLELYKNEQTTTSTWPKWIIDPDRSAAMCFTSNDDTYKIFEEFYYSLDAQDPFYFGNEKTYNYTYYNLAENGSNKNRNKNYENRFIKNWLSVCCFDAF